jgi:hypothetical protein
MARNPMLNELGRMREKIQQKKDSIYNKGGSGYRMKQYKTGTSRYKQAKIQFDQEIKELRKLEADFKPRMDELEAISKKEKEAEAAKEAAKDYKSKVEKLKDEVQRAKDAQDNKAKAAAEAKLKAEYDAQKAAKAKASGTESKTGAQFQLSDEENVANLLSSATVSMGPSGPIVQVTEPNKIDPATGKPTVYQGYLYLTTTGGGTGPKAIFFGTADVIRDRYQKQLIKNYGSKQAVIDKLYKAGYLSTNKEVPTSAYLSALDAAAGEYTVAQVNAYKQEGVKEFPTMDEFLAAKKDTGGLGGTRTRTNITEFSDTAATKIINAISQQWFGRDANGKELNRLIPLINKELKKNPDVVSTTTDAKGNVTSTKTKTGLDVEQFLIEEVSGKDEAKAKQVLDYYNVFKQTLGVN